MDRLDAMKIFLQVVDGGSFAAVGQPTAGEQVAALEQHLGAELLHRNARTLTLTEAGRDFYEAAMGIVADLEAAESRIGHRQKAIAGPVRVAVDAGFGRLYLVPRLPAFFESYPDLQIELLVGVEDGLDLAIRQGESKESGLVTKLLGSTPVVVVASAEYLENSSAIHSPADLKQHQCVTQMGNRTWRFTKGLVHQASGRFQSNDCEQIRQAVLSGLGLAQAPLWLFQAEIASGQVKRILRRLEPDPVKIYAVRPAERRPAARVATFIDFVVQVLKDSQLE